MKPFFSIPKLLLFVLIGTGAFYTLELFFKLYPCKLCILQRIPYYFSLAVLPFTIIKKIRKFIIVCISLAFLSGMMIASFHFLVEEGVVEYICQGSNAKTIEGLLQDILKTRPPCSQKSTIFGFRITIISVFYSFFLFIYSLILSTKNVKKSKFFI